MSTSKENVVFDIADITKEQIQKFCSLILVIEDKLELENGKNYINDFIKEKITISDDRKLIRDIVKKELQNYIRKCEKNGTPLFAFANEYYDVYCEQFEKEYTLMYQATFEQQSDFPIAFVYVFEYIKEVIDLHDLFEEFSVEMVKRASQQATRLAVQEASNAVKSASEDAKKSAIAAQEAIFCIEDSVDEIIFDANVKAQLAQEQAEIASQKAADAARIAVGFEVEAKMSEVTKNISETSVTILGIFAGIVLTVVAGLFYSSSVLESINSANFYRLISVASLVGFVCYSLIALMFRYIERIKYIDKDKHPRFSKLTIVISCVLLIIMVVAGKLQYTVSDKVDKNVQNESVIDVNINATSNEVPMGLDEITKQNYDDPDKNMINLEEETNKQIKDTSN